MADRRQSSARTSPERRISSVSRDTNPDIFSDDFSLEPLAVADGYQPSSSTPDPNRSLPRINVPRSNGHLSNHESKPSTASTRKPRLSSSNAGLAARNSFSLRHDAQYSDAPHRVPSIAYSHTSETSNRPLSIASTFMQPRTQSPFVGNSAPSHPYAMYPQNTSVNRNSTVSTIRPQERSYIGPSHPTHPYGMYAQTTAPEGESNALLGSTDITSVGFPGIPQQYARRLGPNGEEADDIIGPDGHTEQLPPYTRYADALPAKERSAFEPTTPETPISPQSLAGQEPASASVISRDSRAPLNPGGNDLQPGERGSDEAGSREKWMTRGKKRTCFGKLPVWAVALLVIALIAVAAVVGGLVGRYLKGSSKNMVPPPPRSPDGVATTIATLTTTLIDASPIPIPTDMPQAPTGTFNLPMKDASRVESTCLQNADQNAAGVWKCASDTEMQFTVRQRDVGDTLVSLVSYRDRNSKFPYGALPPDVIPESPVRYMLDMDADDYGPALFFQNAYNKTVIVPVGALNATVARRSADEILAEAHRLSLRDDKPKPGEVAWFCYWEQTLFEGFIYLRRDVGNAGSPTTSAASASITPNSGNQQGNYPPAARRHRRGNKSTSEVYPKLVKIEERRTPRSPQPYCKQKKILDDWSAVDVENSPIIKLQEKVFMPKQRVNYATKQMEDGNNSNGGGFGSKGGGGGANGRRSHGSKHAHEKRGGDDQCHCEWMGT